MDSLSTDAGKAVCEAFTPHFFKPSHCIHCFKRKAAHSITMPSQQSTLNSHHREVQESRKLSLGSVNAKASLWIKAATSKDPKVESSGSSVKVHRKPVLRSCFGPQANMLSSADSKLCHTKGSSSNVQNTYHPYPVMRNPPSTKGQVNMKVNGVNGHNASHESKSVATIHSADGQVSNTNGDLNHNATESNLYEAIYPSDENIENFDNQANMILENNKISQRSLSDAASYRKQNKPFVRRTSTPGSAIPESGPYPNVLEFQKLAGRLKHTGRRDGSVSSPAGVEADNHTQVSQQKKRVPPSRCGHSRVEKQRDLAKKNTPVFSERKEQNLVTSQSKRNAKKLHPSHNGLTHLDKGYHQSSASSTSSGELRCDELSKSRSSSVNSCTSAPAVPVRTESKRRSKESGDKPGFALDSLLPDTITIISADGTKEVVTAEGIFQTSGKDGAKVEVQATTEQCSDTAVTDRESGKLPSLKGLPHDVETEINTPLSSVLSSGSDVSYEVVNIGPLSGSQQSDPMGSERTKEDDCRPAAEDPECNSMAGKVSKERVTPSAGQDSIPPFPVILHDSSEHKPKNRNSGNYKVPIFIKHQDYDNLGTVLADQDYEAMQLQQPEEETRGEMPSESQVFEEDLEDQYYLKPTNHDDATGEAETVSDAINEDEYELVSHTPSGKMFSSEEEKFEAEVENPVGTPKRTRSKSHPMFCKEGHLVSGVLPFPSPTNKSKMKRTAPRPPEYSKEDTMPRTPPPPPPTDESRRLSKDLQEGILRYHRSAQASKGNFHVMKGSELETCLKSQMQPGNSTSGHFSISGERESVKVNQEKQNEDRKVVEKASSADRKQKVKPVLHVSTSKGKSAPKPLISPPKAHLLQQLHLSDSPPSHSFHESRQKEKKSLLFWKKRKRKDEGGSPEREYNTEIVTKWLENLDELTPLTQRRSWERMEVINAYKGQETAVIGYKGQTEEHSAKDAVYPVDHVCSGKRKAPKHPRETISSSDSTSQTSPKPVERKNSKENLRPPEKARDDCSNATKSSDERHQDVPSLPIKPPPRTKSQRRRRETVHESPEYVNLAFLKQSMTPPAKPRRRGRTTRSLTTGFENLPSTTKRIAPKAPEDAIGSGKPEFLSNSDPESTANDVNDALSGAAPLKSALKKKSSEQIASGSADAPPKRPVRLIHANAEPMENHHFGLPKTGYVNLEVKQIDFGKASEDTSGSQEAEIVLDQIQSLQRQSFAQLAELYPISALTKELFVGRSLEDFLIHERTLTFSDEQTFCFRAELKEGSSSFGFMVFLHQTCQEKVYEAAKEMEAFPPHPNLLNVVHTFKTALPSHLFTESQDEASQAESKDSPSSQRNAVVVITSQVPTSSAAHFIEESKSREGQCDETYEAEVLDMILQICRGLAHVEEQEPSKSLEGLKQDSVLQMGKGSKIWLFNPLVVETLSSSVPGRRASVVSHLTDRCCEFDLGILIYELLHQANPFAVRTSLMSRNYVPEDLPVLPEKSPYSARLMGLVCELLRRCPEERASAYEAVCIIFAQKFCESVSSGASVLRTKFDSDGLRQLITMKQTELMCSLVSQLSSGSMNKFGISEKLEFLFWSEVDCMKLKKGLMKAQEISTINAQTE